MHQCKNKVFTFASKIACMNIVGEGVEIKIPGIQVLGRDDADE